MREFDWSLLTDLYQLTMASAYWQSGRSEQRAVFNLNFRRAPFGGSFAVVCGTQPAAEWLAGLRFGLPEIEYLQGLKAGDGSPLFSHAFLEYLAGLKFSCDVWAMPEGTVAFAHEPLLRVEGPILQCQLAETALLCFVNFQTLIATKAARVVHAAAGRQVLEFGLRRAQNVDGALAASRAAYVGGVDATSNVLAGAKYGIPVRGTHAHSWVMSFESEPEAFAAYVDAMPANSVLLVDTYDTLDGVRHAVEAGQRLRERGHELGGIRLDSGDLAYLSREARRILDDAGFPNAKILASNDLDEEIIESLIAQGAAIDAFGVGTKLVTAYDQPALGGVYKLGAIWESEGWIPKIKASEQSAKSSIPGRLNTRRFFRDDGSFLADAIFDENAPPKAAQSVTIVSADDPLRRRDVRPGVPHRDLLQQVFSGGKLLQQNDAKEAVGQARDRATDELSRLHPTIRRIRNPHAYPAGLEEGLHDRRADMILRARGSE